MTRLACAPSANPLQALPLVESGAAERYRLNSHHLPSGKVSLVEVTAMAISSTGCRERVERGEPVWYLVPDGVVRYIAKKDLYRKSD